MTNNDIYKWDTFSSKHKQHRWQYFNGLDKAFCRRSDFNDAVSEYMERARQHERRPLTTVDEVALVIPLARKYCDIPATEPVTIQRAHSELSIAAKRFNLMVFTGDLPMIRRIIYNPIPEVRRT